MFPKQSFDNNIYMKIIRWIYILLISNLCLILMNIPFFIAVTSLAFDIQNVPIFFLSTLFVGPGMIALIATIDQFVAEKDIDPFKDFFKNVLQFGFRGLIYWIVGWSGLMIGVLDGLFFMSFSIGKWLVPFFVVLMLLTMAISINSWYFQARNPSSSMKDVLRIASYYAIKKWYISILNIALLIVMVLLMILKPQFGFTITPFLFIGMIYLNSRKLHKVQSTENMTV